MKVAITGGTGLLGRYTVEILKENCFTPIVFSRRKTNKGIRKTDYSYDDLVRKLTDIDAVIHLAANRGPAKKIGTYHEDQIITQNLYDACKKNNITNIIFASSISVYSEPNKLPWTESQIVSPTSLYGIGKYTNEMIGKYYSENYNLKVKNLRFAHLFGFNERNNYMINLFMRKAYNKEPLTLETSSTGKREFLYTKDAAKAILKSIEKPNNSGTYNIGSNTILTNEEVAYYINLIFNNKSALEVVNPNSPDSTKSSYMSHEIAKKELGYRAQYTFTEALEEIYKDMRGLKNVPIRY